MSASTRTSLTEGRTRVHWTQTPLRMDIKGDHVGRLMGSHSYSLGEERSVLVFPKYGTCPGSWSPRWWDSCTWSSNVQQDRQGESYHTQVIDQGGSCLQFTNFSPTGWRDVCEEFAPPPCLLGLITCRTKVAASIGIRTSKRSATLFPNTS